MVFESRQMQESFLFSKMSNLLLNEQFVLLNEGKVAGEATFYLQLVSKLRVSGFTLFLSYTPLWRSKGLTYLNVKRVKLPSVCQVFKDKIYFLNYVLNIHKAWSSLRQLRKMKLRPSYTSHGTKIGT